MKKKLLLSCVLSAVSLCVSAVDVSTYFVGQSKDGKFYALDSVSIENVTQGWSRTIECTEDTTLFTTSVIPNIATEIENIWATSTEDGLISNYRNYGYCHHFSINVDQEGILSIRILDVVGRYILNYNEHCKAGFYAFRLSLSQSLPFILFVSTYNRQEAKVIFNTCHTGLNSLSVEANTPVLYTPLRQQDTYDITEGDKLHFIGYSHRQGEVLISEQITKYQNLSDEIVSFIFESATLSDEGIYVGLMGFNNNLYAYPIGIFSTSNLSEYNSFIDARTMANGTILAHAVYNALDSLQMAPIPDKLADAALVIFTDGLENASWRKNSLFKNSDSYMQAVSNRIHRMWINGIRLTSYSIGVKGNDVLNEEGFERQLMSLASDSTCFYKVADMNEVKKKFRDIAAKISNSHASYSLSLSIPAQNIGDRIRLTFDNIDDAAQSEYFIEGTYDFDFDEYYGYLYDVVYNGITCTNGSTLVSTPDDIFDIFTIDNLMTNLGERVDVSNIQQWYYVPGTNQWQVNSEFTPATGVNITEERNSAIVMLVLDCSSSLGSDFTSVQTNAKDFLNVLAGQTTFSKPSISTKNPILGKLSATLGGTIINDGSLTIVDRGVCISKYSNMDSVQFYPSSSESNDFDVTIEGLTEGEKYYYHAYARNNVGVKYGEKRQFIVMDFRIPTVSTFSASASGYTTALVSGQVISDGNQNVTERGVCYSTSHNPTIDDLKATKGSGTGTFSCSLSDLEAGATYYVRAYAINSMGVGYGEELSFTTQAYSLPTVTTSSSWTVDYTSASASCSVNTTGGATVTERGVCYATHENPTTEDSKVSQGSGAGAYSVTISGLEEGTIYYVRAYAVSVAGTGYGDEISFRTKGSVPSVSFSHLGAPTSTSVSCIGNVTSNGGVTLTEKGFCYGLEPNPDIEGEHLVVAGITPGSFSGTITGLVVSTTYYVRAYAANKLGVSYSDQQTFTTADGLATITTGSVTATATTITAESEVTGNGGFDVLERGICYSTTNSAPTIADEKVTSGTGNGSFSLTITDVLPSVTYYLRAYATNANGTAYGNVVTITTKSGAAKVILGAISNISPISATSTVKVTNVYGAAIQQCGLCWSTSEEPTIEDSIVRATGTTLNTTYTCNMSGLRPGTTYYVRAFAATEIQTSYSTQLSFTTADGLPTVTTNTSATTTAISISAGGEVTANGGFDVLERGFCYSATNSVPTIADGKVAEGEGNGAFSVTISGLQASTQYYLRAYATNENGTTYGSVITATTKSGTAALTLGNISNITAVSASSTVKVTSVAGAIVQQCGLCWSVNEYPTTEDTVSIASGTTMNTTYTCNMFGLRPGTTYYVRAFAITSAGRTSYSSQKSFTTADGLPTVTTNTSATTTAISISAGGEVTANGGFDVLERGICYSATNSVPTVADGKVAEGEGNGAFSVTISGLQASTQYYLRAYATNENGTTYGSVITATTNTGIATLTLGSISNIKALSATSTVRVSSVPGATVQQCGLCWSTSSNPTKNDNMVEAEGTTIGITYNCDMTDLQPNTTYYVRAFATTTANRTSYSSQKSFTTPSGMASVTTELSLSSVNSITVAGNVTDDGGYNILERGICYSTINSTPTIAESHIASGSGLGSYSITVTELPLNTQYYVRAYATNCVGTSYSDVVIVSTRSGLATVITTIIGENVTSTTANGGGTVTEDDGFAVTERGICWSTYQSPTIADNKISAGNGLGNFACQITGLQISGNNVYWVRAYATNENGTAYGKAVKVSKENLDYKNLPTFQFGGYTYRLGNDMGAMTWNAAQTACDNLTYGGYDDWYIPTHEELVYIMQNYKLGWYEEDGTPFVFSTSATSGSAQYWTSTPYPRYENEYYVVYYSYYKYYSNYVEDEQGNVSVGTNRNRVRPVRKY